MNEKDMETFYYYNIPAAEFRPIKGTPVTLEGFPGIDFFAHSDVNYFRNNKNIIISEARTGCYVGEGATMEVACRNAIKRLSSQDLEATKTYIKTLVCLRGLSPRYKEESDS